MILWRIFTSNGVLSLLPSVHRLLLCSRSSAGMPPGVENVGPENSVRTAGRLEIRWRLCLHRSGQLKRSASISLDTQDWTGDGAALRDASASLCGSGQKHALVCTSVSVCE